MHFQRHQIKTALAICRGRFFFGFRSVYPDT